MGASTSKTVRALPKRPATPHPPWSGARPSRPTQAASETKNQGKKNMVWFEFTTQAALQLGQVRVDHHMQTVNLEQTVRNTSNSRLHAEADAATLNHIPASTFSRLLDERKAVRTRRDMQFLAKRFGLEVEKLDLVAQFVTTPSVRANSQQRVAQQDGSDRYIMQVKSKQAVVKNAS
ncbi:hypothetical protein MIND_01047000 [Mycena indigotica]|uniref:Uncharacterized protein n=1 Tax=Mycena indigotica TaxID=2126181 RepID=A0A8H6S9Y6_9AGAR|nr:uncharacterized protein MIND_01047000 [Mycena indigotica]KAF7295087.1 hypothetical protein MIND_01047000 [Mycena indigotica]